MRPGFLKNNKTMSPKFRNLSGGPFGRRLSRKSPSEDSDESPKIKRRIPKSDTLPEPSLPSITPLPVTPIATPTELPITVAPPPPEKPDTKPVDPEVSFSKLVAQQTDALATKLATTTYATMPPEAVSKEQISTAITQVIAPTAPPTGAFQTSPTGTSQSGYPGLLPGMDLIPPIMVVQQAKDIQGKSPVEIKLKTSLTKEEKKESPIDLIGLIVRWFKPKSKLEGFSGYITPTMVGTILLLGLGIWMYGRKH